MRSGPAASDLPCFYAELPEPQATIANTIIERKEKPQKMRGKMRFSWGSVEIAAKNGTWERIEASRKHLGKV
jgi:hypothetical protein